MDSTDSKMLRFRGSILPANEGTVGYGYPASKTIKGTEVLERKGKKGQVVSFFFNA